MASGHFDLAESVVAEERSDGDGTKKKPPQPTQAEKLIQLAFNAFVLFHDDQKDAYARTQDGQVLKVRNSAFRQRLAHLLWQRERKAPNSDALAQALNVIEARAVFEAPKITLHNRVAEHEGKFFYDLSNGSVVEITPDGWAVREAHPILFKHYSHQQPQVAPRSGDIDRIFDFLNVRERRHRLLVAVYVVSCLVPNIPHPIVHPWGDQGSGKTSMFTFLKGIIDPSKLSVLIAPRELEETVQTLEHHHLVLFDNLSAFPDWLSNLLSQASTGGGFSKRRLYTDDDDVIYNFMRCVGINGINLLVSQPDFMDRTILLHLERIEPRQRREQRELMRAFEEARPHILGGILDALSRAMEIYPHIRLAHLPRMADFLRWGVAIAEALGYSGQEFVEAYEGNIRAQSAEIVNSNTLAQAVITLMSDRDEWAGTVSQAHQELAALVTVNKEDRTFPKAANKLRNALNRIRPNLLDCGIKFEIADFHAEKGVHMSLRRIGTLSTGSSASSESGEINELSAVDTLNVADHPSDLSSGGKPLKTKDAEGPEHPEDGFPSPEGPPDRSFSKARVFADDATLTEEALF